MSKKVMVNKVLSYDDFLYVTEKNNRCDALANEGIDSLR